MGQLVGDDVERTGEVGEEHAVAVAEHHLLPVPEGVGVAVAIVDVPIQPHAEVVDGVPLQDRPVEVARLSQAVEGIVDGCIRRGARELGPHQAGATEVVGVPDVEDRPPPIRRRAGGTEERRADRALAAQLGRRQKRVERRPAHRRLVARQEVLQHMWGRNAVDAAAHFWNLLKNPLEIWNSRSPLAGSGFREAWSRRRATAAAHRAIRHRRRRTGWRSPPRRSGCPTHPRRGPR